MNLLMPRKSTGKFLVLDDCCVFILTEDVMVRKSAGWISEHDGYLHSDHMVLLIMCSSDDI